MHDAILPIGMVAARQMGWDTIPIVALKNPHFKSGDWVEICSDGIIKNINRR
jgi:hypothetical protein